MKSGVYKITCTANGNYYIGVSKNIQRRWSQHRTTLKKGKHHSFAMQEDWDKFGDGCFSFEVIKECEYSDAKKLEEELIKSENPKYNMSDLNETIKGKHRLFMRKIMKVAAPFITPLFYRGKKILMFEIEYLSEVTSLTIIEILQQIGVDRNGFNTSMQSLSHNDIYVGSLLVDDNCYITLTCADDGSRYKTTIKRIENPCVKF